MVSSIKQVLAIESSCDDTSVAIVKKKEGEHSSIELLWMNSHSQEKMLRPWAGVVPELAARNHAQHLFPIINNIPQTLLDSTDALAVTQGPGLLGPLLTGIFATQLLSLELKLPVIPVNHLWAHLQAIHFTKKMTYPYLGMVLSGGHTFIAIVLSTKEWKLLSTTLDDALGEALDKGGKMLGLAYPGGKLMDQLTPFGNNQEYQFPIGLRHQKTTHLSYSGLKNSLRLLIEKKPTLPEQARPLIKMVEDYNDQKIDTELFRSLVAKELENPEIKDFVDIIASYTNAAFEAILVSLTKTIHHYSIQYPSLSKIPIVIAGGVANSKVLRQKITQHSLYGAKCLFVDHLYCSDNGAMIGAFALEATHQLVPMSEVAKIAPFSRYVDREELVFLHDQKK